MPRRDRILQWAGGRGGAILVAVLGALLLLPPPNMPAAGLDPSWVLALENAARERMSFGGDFVFTFGPFGLLATRLFDGGTYGFAILSDFVITGIFLIPLLWSRRPLVIALYLVAILAAAVFPLALDSRIVIAYLVVTFLGMRGRGWAAIACAALLSPLLLAKFSYTLAALPLLALADVYRMAAFRRVPLLVPVSLAGMLAGMLATGHSIGALPGLAWNVLQIIGGYPSAMALDTGGWIPLVAAAGAMVAITACAFWAARARQLPAAEEWRWLRPALAVIAIAWACFIAFKMGYVRQSPYHLFLTWHAFVLMIPVTVAFFDEISPFGRRETLVFAGLATLCVGPIPFLDAVLYMYFTNPSPVAYVRQRATDLVTRPLQTLGWLTPQRWQAMAEQRRQAEAAIARRLPPGVSGSMDVIPYDAGPVIASSALYRPRPVPQSYSSYTPALQQLDADHFADPARAPDTLFLKIGDVDDRLPTLSVGPSLLVIARWYDVTRASPLGLILQRRASPRPAREQSFPARPFALDEWIAVPAAGDAQIFATVEMGPNLLGRAFSFLVRGPTALISLRFDDGTERTYRYIPGMGQIAFLISPMTLDPDIEKNLRGTVGMLERSAAPDAVRNVVAIRFSGGGIGSHSFSTGNIAFRALALEPGITGGLRAAPAPRIGAPPANGRGAGTSPPAPAPAASGAPRRSPANR